MKFNFFYVRGVDPWKPDALFEMPHLKNVEIPDFDNESQALEWYKNHWKETQKKVDDENLKNEEFNKKFPGNKKVNYLPKKIYILPEWDIEKEY